ncbi:NAD(P)/FAD-dependent oxidoreductase [Candidatus Uhrbacteria bacterium]|nr:NAD(P)/FAD-dependent oxidoreductase [Candidatus Uhrbacteria bacterium]
MRYLIIGGGIAGTTAVEELRKLDSSDEITLVSEEQHALYSRVLLPHYLKGKIPRERVFLKKESWYEEQKIEWVRGISVVKLDPKNTFVELSDGRELPYDKLLIATGGELRTLGLDVRGVSYLRTLDDADHLNQLLAEQGSSCRGGVYGGGFIACEYINLFAHFGIPTTVIFRGNHFWSKGLEPEVGRLINQHLIKKGVELHPGGLFVDTMGERELTGFISSLGEHPCTILGVGIGIESDDGWLREAGVKVEAGIVCDEFLQTSEPNIFAAGDVAEFYDINVGRHVRVGNWMNAQMQGRVVAKNMAGEKTVFSLVSSYATNALGLEIIFVGDVSRAHADEVRLVGSVEQGGITQLFSRAGQLIGAVLVGRNTDRPIITKMIQEKRRASEFK